MLIRPTGSLIQGKNYRGARKRPVTCDNGKTWSAGYAHRVGQTCVEPARPVGKSCASHRPFGPVPRRGAGSVGGLCVGPSWVVPADDGGRQFMRERCHLLGGPITAGPGRSPPAFSYQRAAALGFGRRSMRGGPRRAPGVGAAVQRLGGRQRMRGSPLARSAIYASPDLRRRLIDSGPGLGRPSMRDRGGQNPSST